MIKRDIPETKSDNFSLMKIICIICIVANSGYTLSTASRSISIILLGILTIIIFVAKVTRKSRYENQDGSEMIVLVLFFSIISALLINQDIKSIFEYARFIMLILCGLWIAKMLPPQMIAFYFTRIMRIITISSLIFFLIFVNFGNVFELPTIINSTGAKYYNAFVFFIQISTSLRNSAIFWEPGLYAVFLTIALVLEIIYVPKSEKNIIYIVLHVIAMITTQSTAGFFYLIIIAIFALSRKAVSSKLVILVILLCMATVFLYLKQDEIVNQLAQWSPMVFGKILDQTSSYTDRTGGPIIDAIIFVRNPLGCGLGKLTTLVKEISFDLNRLVRTRTTTLTFFFACFGVVGGLAYNFMWLFGILKQKAINGFGKILLILLFIAVATASPLYSNLSVWILIFALYGSTQENKRENINRSTHLDAITSENDTHDVIFAGHGKD